MLIIISGCDRTGKSTIAQQLADKLNAVYTHFSYPSSKEEAKQEYYNFIETISLNKMYICDRFYEGEYVYAPIYRDYQLDYSHEIERKIKDTTSALFIYVRADLHVIQDRIKSCGEDYVKDEDIIRVINNYDLFINQLMLPYIILDNNTLDDLSNNICISLDAIKTMDFIYKEHILNKLPLPFGNLQAKSFISHIYNKDFSEDIVNINNYTDFWFTQDKVVEKEIALINPQEVLPYGL